MNNSSIFSMLGSNGLTFSSSFYTSNSSSIQSRSTNNINYGNTNISSIDTDNNYYALSVELRVSASGSGSTVSTTALSFVGVRIHYNTDRLD